MQSLPSHCFRFSCCFRNVRSRYMQQLLLSPKTKYSFPLSIDFHNGWMRNFHSTKLSSSRSEYDDLRPFRILGIQQIAVGSLDKSSLVHLWGNLLGLKQVGEYKSEKENVDEDIYIMKDGVEVDLMKPIDPNKSPKVHSPPLNHVGLWVDDLEAAVSWLSDPKQGVRFAPGGIRKGASGYNVAFIHPSPSDEKPVGGCGVLIELVQAPKNIQEANRH